jgi:adenylate kinase family enzyme
MILFLFGQWGSGKSHIAHKIEEWYKLPHLDADQFFTQEMVDAVKACELDPHQMTDYYQRVIATMHGYEARHPHFMVTQGIYTDLYRRQIYREFLPDIRFVLVKTPDLSLQRQRIGQRARATGNPVSLAAYEYMTHYWEPISIPHAVLWNDEFVDDSLECLLADLNLSRPFRLRRPPQPTRSQTVITALEHRHE